MIWHSFHTQSCCIWSLLKVGVSFLLASFCCCCHFGCNVSSKPWLEYLKPFTNFKANGPANTKLYPTETIGWYRRHLLGRYLYFYLTLDITYGYTIIKHSPWAMVVVKWSTCSASTLPYRVWIPLKLRYSFSYNLGLKRTKINKKRPGIAPF